MVKKLMIAACSLIFTLALAEGAVRVLFPEWAPRTAQLVDFWQYDERYGWSHVPGAQGRFDSYGFDVEVTINEQGFRGPLVTPRKDPAKTRVLVVGDSLVWGFGAAEEDTFVVRMEERCPNLEVINFGVSGYATDQELLLFNERGRSLAPDVVVLVVASNDFSDNIRSTVNVYYNKPLYRLEGDRLVLTNRPVPPPDFLVATLSSIARHSYLLTQLGRTIHGVELALEDVPAAAAGSAPTERQDGPAAFPRNKAERMTARLIAEFLSEVRASGAIPAVVFNDPRGGLVSAYLGLDDIAVIQLGDMKDDPDPERYHLRGDFHWNAAGHDVVAQRILEGLVAKGTLESCDAGPST